MNSMLHTDTLKSTLLFMFKFAYVMLKLVSFRQKLIFFFLLNRFFCITYFSWGTVPKSYCVTNTCQVNIPIKVTEMENKFDTLCPQVQVFNNINCKACCCKQMLEKGLHRRNKCICQLFVKYSFSLPFLISELLYSTGLTS